ncbi:MAG: helix-turn-helix domain-containing protein, partial [Alphaproteobacteria bacterium]
LNMAPPAQPGLLADLSRTLARKRRAVPISDRARRMIYAEMHDGNVCQEHIARELGVSSRTMRRKLAAEGLSYQALLDDCRMRFAAHEFRTREKLSLSEMALKLGYSEHSTFTRAFARWTGMAPQAYRRAIVMH